MFVYELHNIDTGKLLFREEVETPLSIRIWQNKKCRKLLKYKRTPEETKQAIREGNVLAGWANYDELRRAGYDKEIDTWVEKMFCGY